MAIKGSERNVLCKCNSGLKAKECHGNPMFRQAAGTIADHMMTLLITQRAHEKDLVDAETAKDAIDKIVANANNYLPECVELNTAYTVAEDVPEPVDKLEEKEKEGASIENLQEDTVLCGCGMRLPTGMECMKCKKKEN